MRHWLSSLLPQLFREQGQPSAGNQSQKPVHGLQPCVITSAIPNNPRFIHGESQLIAAGNVEVVLHCIVAHGFMLQKYKMIGAVVCMVFP